MQQTENYTPRIAVIGSGYWGKNLVRNFNQIGALQLICDRSEITLERFREQYQGIKTCLALTEVLSDETIKGVAIATPAETHYSLVKEALLGGKNVYVEKPLVLDEDEAEELIELGQANGTSC
jgi:UDP-2-acetamido-3-amino-2,3-dideoxy-glucuronate N-acetyltransferase